MNGKNIHDAVEYVGYDLIDAAENQRFLRPVWQTLLPVAAMVALLIGLGTAAVRHLQPPVVVPPLEQEKPVPEEVPVVEEALPEEPEADLQIETHPLLECFPQLDADTLPVAVEDWEVFYLNEAGLEDSGTDIYTTQGDQVLAVDVRNGILLVRVQGVDYRGVLAITKDAERLSLQTSSQIGVSGETVGVIAQAHNGILAINGGPLLSDDDGSGKKMAGYAMCDGVAYQEGEHLGSDSVRLEINEDGRFSLTDPQAPVSADTKNAVETPFALIQDGQAVVEKSVARPINPRACLGQTERGEILMLVIEGRMPDEGIFGIDLWECAQILARYGCENALQLDTGTSAMLWFDGEYVTRCSNQALPEGRLLPTAFVVESLAE